MWLWFPVVVSCLLGAAGGWWWSYHQHVGTMDTIKWIAVGVLVGLVMSLLGPWGRVLLSF